MTYPLVENKYEYQPVGGPGTFLDSARAGGWDPGPMPTGVIFKW
jgi:hypothetical protein